MQPLTINFSVAHGQVVFGAVGDDTRLEYTVIGGPVNLSAKLEKHNKETGTAALTTTACVAIAKDQGFATDRVFNLCQTPQLSESLITSIWLCWRPEIAGIGTGNPDLPHRSLGLTPDHHASLFGTLPRVFAKDVHAKFNRCVTTDVATSVIINGGVQRD